MHNLYQLLMCIYVTKAAGTIVSQIVSQGEEVKKYV